MTVLVEGHNAVEAWLAGVDQILKAPQNRIRNLITEIEQGTAFDRTWLKRFDPKTVGAKDRLSVVVKVLFPITSRKAELTRQQFYDQWNDALSRSKKQKRLHANWGTYFGRLTNFAGSENQLERIIHVLSSWKNRPEAAIVAHLSAPTLDSIQPIGSPCLQYVEILWSRTDTIDLVAVYRNHDFLNKSFGNFIGLGRLLDFIASESGKQPGRIICHSVRAYCDRPNQLRNLILK